MNDAGSRLVTFALPDESRPLVASLRSPVVTLHRGRAPALPTYVGHCGDPLITIVHTGVGDTPAGRQRLTGLLTDAKKPRWVISAGYAGGLSPVLKRGDLVLGENYSDPALVRSARSLLRGEPLHVGPLASQPLAAESVAAKAALAAETGTLAVDMETGWIADVCALAGVPLLSLRVISDAADQPFPVPGHFLFDATRQRPRYFRLPLYLLTHPGRLAPFAGFVRGLGPARTRLTRALQTLVPAL